MRCFHPCCLPFLERGIDEGVPLDVPDLDEEGPFGVVEFAIPLQVEQECSLQAASLCLGGIARGNARGTRTGPGGRSSPRRSRGSRLETRRDSCRRAAEGPEARSPGRPPLRPAGPADRRRCRSRLRRAPARSAARRGPSPSTGPRRGRRPRSRAGPAAPCRRPASSRSRTCRARRPSRSRHRSRREGTGSAASSRRRRRHRGPWCGEASPPRSILRGTASSSRRRIPIVPASRSGSGRGCRAACPGFPPPARPSASRTPGPWRALTSGRNRCAQSLTRVVARGDPVDQLGRDGVAVDGPDQLGDLGSGSGRWAPWPADHREMSAGACLGAWIGDTHGVEPARPRATRLRFGDTTRSGKVVDPPATPNS